jgi:hypothetical protein
MRGWIIQAMLLLALAVPVMAQTPATNPGATPAERWLWERLRAPLGRPEFAVNLAQNCGGQAADPTNPEDPGWADPCREVSAGFIEAILSQDPWRGQLPRRGLRLQNMLVRGTLDLSALQIGAEVWLDNSRFTDPVILTGARFEKTLTFDNSALEGGFSADQLQVGGNLQLSGTARIGCLVDADAPCGWMVLNAATISGDLRLEGAVIATGLAADDLTVNGSFILSGTKIDGGLVGAGLHVARGMFLDRGADLGCTPVVAGQGCDALVLRNATIEGQLGITGATLRGNMQANSLKVRNHLQLRDTALAHPAGTRVNLSNARIDGDLDLTNAALQQVTLANAVIGGDLQLSTDQRPPPRWAPNAQLSLRNAHAAAVQGGLEPDHHAWPPVLEFQGFVYDRLGGGSFDALDPMMSRPTTELVGWLARDRSFTRQPYQQLASVFTAAGDPNRATDILFAARYREELLDWEAGATWDALGLAALRVTIGYGLGYKFFRVLWWVLGFCLLGTLVLLCCRAGRAKGVLWCFGASLDQLIPFATLSPEFAPFFDDPRRERLAGWQVAFFALQSLVGFVLGGFVGAGLGGLTQAN